MAQLSELRQQVNDALIAKAQSDPAFRQALLKDSSAAIEREFGISLPTGFEWRVVEETAAINYLVLPASAADELSEADLAAVAGGSLKLMGEILSNVSKTRSEISMTFARNARA